MLLYLDATSVVVGITADDIGTETDIKYNICRFTRRAICVFVADVETVENGKVRHKLFKFRAHRKKKNVFLF